MQALKEWAVVCNALESGRQVVVLRKGGILEYRQGFEVKHEKFLMFPTFEHQSAKYLQPDYAGKLAELLKNPPPAGITRLASYAEAKEVREVRDRAVLHRLGGFHVWNESYVNARMDYNPSKPMSVVLLRVFRLNNPIQVRNHDAWAGCKSWVPVDIDDAGIESDSIPVLSDSEFDRVAGEFRGVLSVPA
jgi:hypothetical protein